MDGDNIGHALRGYADRVVRLHEERKALNHDIGEVYGEAKEAGFNITTLREIVREMQMEPDARASRYELLNEYRMAVGILADTPLGRAAEPQPSDEGEPVSGQGAPMVARPRPLAEQPLHRGRGRPRKADVGSKPMFDA